MVTSHSQAENPVLTPRRQRVDTPVGRRFALASARESRARSKTTVRAGQLDFSVGRLSVTKASSSSIERSGLPTGGNPVAMHSSKPSSDICITSSASFCRLVGSKAATESKTIDFPTSPLSGSRSRTDAHLTATALALALLGMLALEAVRRAFGVPAP